MNGVVVSGIGSTRCSAVLANRLAECPPEGPSISTVIRCVGRVPEGSCPARARLGGTYLTQDSSEDSASECTNYTRKVNRERVLGVCRVAPRPPRPLLVRKRKTSRSMAWSSFKRRAYPALRNVTIAEADHSKFRHKDPT